MKIQFHITGSLGGSLKKDVRQPLIGIGRDPSGAVVLEGDAGKGVSWNHARIDVEGKKLFIIDLGSSNGTLVNDKPIIANTVCPITPKDRIQLGFTGPKILITAFEPDQPGHSPSMSVMPPPISSTPIWKIAALVLLGIALPVLSYFAFFNKKETNAKSDDKKGSEIVQKKADETLPIVKKDVIPTKDDTPKIEVPKDVIPIARGMVGRAVKSDTDPGTLLQWPGEPFPWTPLANGDRVNYGSTLLALPGFRCKVDLESGLRMIALSNLPEFDSKAPVFETVWIHDQAAPGFDGRLLFDRGRMWFGNGKSSGACKIQLQMRNADWVIELADKESQAVVECWFDLPIAPKLGIPGLPKSEPVIGFFTKGKVTLRSGDNSYPLDGVQFLLQEGNARTIIRPKQALKDWPTWWTNDPFRSNDLNTLEAAAAVTDWAKVLEKSVGLIEAVRRKVAQEDDRAKRTIGYLALGAFDVIEQLFVDLESTKQSDEARRAALLAIQVWLSRNEKHVPALFEVVTLKRNLYSAAKAQKILRLIVNFADSDWKNPEMYQEWVRDLSAEDAIVRFLAVEKLRSVLGSKVKEMPKDYNPNTAPEKQEAAIAKWKQLVPAGWVPE